jgi:FkbM family methyltransferase
MTTFTAVARIDLEALAGPNIFNRTVHLEEMDATVASFVRGKEMRFLASSRRLLWQSLGQEYIEPELLDFIDAIPSGCTLFDVGASTGIFSLYAACKGCDVVAFEPEAANFSILSHNAFLNRKGMAYPIRCFNLALSNYTGLSNMFVKKYEAGGHLKILDKPQEVGAGVFEPEHVQPILTFKGIDFLRLTGISVPEYLKIDVDGAELPVLEGMLEIISHPMLRSIFIELEEDKPDSKLCLELLREAGFQITKKKQVQNYAGLHNLVLTRSA